MNESNIKKAVAHWIESAERDNKTMHNLFKTKDYVWALFVGHLVIEKLIKALHVKRNKSDALFIHDLRRLISKIDCRGIGRTKNHPEYYYLFQPECKIC
jgi:HEPN domain-containing protein